MTLLPKSSVQGIAVQFTVGLLKQKHAELLRWLCTTFPTAPIWWVVAAAGDKAAFLDGFVASYGLTDIEGRWEVVAEGKRNNHDLKDMVSARGHTPADVVLICEWSVLLEWAFDQGFRSIYVGDHFRRERSDAAANYPSLGFFPSSIPGSGSVGHEEVPEFADIPNLFV